MNSKLSKSSWMPTSENQHYTACLRYDICHKQHYTVILLGSAALFVLANILPLSPVA